MDEIDMKTLIIYDDGQTGIQFTVVDGDHSEYGRIYLNSGIDEPLEDKFLKFFYNDDGSFKHSLSSDSSVVEDKNWDKVVVCTLAL